MGMRGLQDKVALVTGGGSGIGRGIVQRLAEEGVRCGIVDLDAVNAEQVAREVRAAGGIAEVAVADIADYGAVQTAVDKLEHTLGDISVLVNNAGWDKPIPFLDTDPNFWRKVIDINLYGPLNMHHVVVPRMVASGGGRVVNIASDAARVGSSGEAVYSACKGGIVAFSKTLCRELARDGVLLNCICPGPSDTPLLASFDDGGEGGSRLVEGLKRAIPLKRLGTPQDIAGLVAFLASDEASFIMGQTISVSGGLTMHG